MFKAVIFDLDGVLVDSEPLHFEAHKIALKVQKEKAEKRGGFKKRGLMLEKVQ